MDIHINGFDVVLVLGAVVMSLIAWTAAAIGSVYTVANVRPISSMLFSYLFVLGMIVLAMYAGSVK